jgi:hypothetical protein
MAINTSTRDVFMAISRRACLWRDDFASDKASSGATLSAFAGPAAPVMDTTN